MALATLDGVDIFGPAVSIRHVPNPSANQISAFFGVSGTLSQFGGTRGRIFEVTGVAVAGSVPGLRAIEETWQSYNDGVARVLVDCYDYAWPNVVFKGEFQFNGPVGVSDAGYVQAYRAVLHGLS